RETAEYLANNVELLPLNRETAIKLNRMLTKGLVPENERGNYLFRTGPRVGGTLEQTDEFVAGEPERFYKWLESEPAKVMGRKDPVALAEIIHNNLAALDSFPDGNGRLSRLMSDLALMKSGHPPAKYTEQADYFARGNPRAAVPREIRQQYYKEIVESGDESFRAEKAAVANKAVQETPPPSVELQALKGKGTRDFWDDVDALKENERLKVYTRSPNGYEEPMLIVKRGDGKLYRETVIGRKIEFTPTESEAPGSGSLRVFLEKSRATMITEEEHEIAAIRGTENAPTRAIASLDAPEGTTVRNAMVNEDSLAGRLAKTIDDDFDLNVEPNLVGKAHVPTRPESELHFASMGKLWREARPSEDFIKSIEKAAQTGKLDGATKTQLKYIRGRAKTIRFLCEAVCKDNAQLEKLDQLTVVLGHVSDAIALDGRQAIRREASDLSELLRKKNLGKIDDEISGMQALKGKQLADRIDDTLKDIRKTVKEKKLEEEPFHEMRKNLGRLQTVVLMNALKDGAKAGDRSSYQAIRKIYAEIGEIHDGMVKAIHDGKEPKPARLTDAQRGKINDVLNYFTDDPEATTVRNSMVDSPAPRFDPEKTYDAKTLEQRIFAVHATEFFPEDGVIKAGASDVSGAKAIVTEEPPSFRPTTHWALGELVREHQASWEKHPYAFVLPVGDLKKQLVNLNTYDTFTLGDFTLPEGAIAVVPEGFNKKIPPGVRVETYKPGTSLRAAVDRSIEKHGGWHIEMKASRSPSLDSVGTIDGHSVNTADFFAPILKENPNVSFGDHIQSQVGTANRMGNVEQSINLLMKQYRSGGFVQDTKEVVFLRKFMDHQLAKLDQELPLSKFPKAAAATYQEKVRKLKDWLNVVDADLQLRKNHGLSIAGVNKPIAKKIESLRSDPEALHSYLFDDLKLKGLTMAEAGQEGIPSRSLATYLAGSPLSEAQDLTKFIEKEGLMAPADLQSAKLLYSVKRSLAVDLDKARSEGLLGEMESGFEALKNKPEVVGAAMDELADYLDETSSRLPSALKMIEMPEVKSALEARYGMEIPEDGLTLDRFLRAHPETKSIYEKAPVARNTAGDAILGKLGRNADGPDPEKISSFKAAKSAAWGKEWAKKSYAENLKGLQAPMRSARELKDVGAGNKLSIYEIMKRGDFGKPEQMWEKLGLKEQYREMFPKDADFWKSRQSLEEIYTRLEGGDTQRGWVDSLLGRRLAKQRAYEDLAADKRFTAQVGKIDKVLGSERREELLRGVSRLDGADQERFLNRLKTIADDPDSAELTMLREAMEGTPPSCFRGASATESGMKGRMAWGQSLGLPRLAFMVFALLSPSEGIGGGRCPDLVVEALHRIVNPQTDTAVELELAANPNVMKLITTTDGKVSGLLQGQPAPQWFVDFVKEKVPLVRDPAQLSWDKLHNSVQRRLIKTVSAERKQKFFENREIKGLVHKKEVKLKFSKPTTFLGKRYEAGEHTVDVSRVFKGKVEHSGPDMSGNGVELHFRGNQEAGRMSNDAWKL
ncbi:MAG TPA: Fic family protein, partial [Bdellovibrionota bacterium]